MYLAINGSEVDACVMGKSNLWRKSDLERTTLGRGQGIAGYGQTLGEDGVLGIATWHELGMRHAMNGDVVGNTIGSMPLSAYIKRRIRWIRVRKFVTMFVASKPHNKSLTISLSKVCDPSGAVH